MWGKPVIVVRRYQSERDYERDAPRWVKRGYRVAHVVSETPRAGCMRIVTLGIFTLLFPPKAVFIVTYQRE